MPEITEIPEWPSTDTKAVKSGKDQPSNVQQPAKVQKPSNVQQPLNVQQSSNVQQPLRTRKTDKQLRVLRDFFRKCRYPSRQEKLELSQKTGLDLYKVNTWFQNQRVTFKFKNRGLNNFCEASFKSHAENFLVEKSLRNIHPTNQANHKLMNFSKETQYPPQIKVPQTQSSLLPVVAHNPFLFLPQETLMMWSEYLRSVAQAKDSFNAFSRIYLNNNLPNIQMQSIRQIQQVRRSE